MQNPFSSGDNIGERMAELGAKAAKKTAGVVKSTGQSIVQTSSPSDSGTDTLTSQVPSGGELSQLENNQHQNPGMIPAQSQVPFNPQQKNTHAEMQKIQSAQAELKQLAAHMHKDKYYDPLMQKVEDERQKHSTEYRAQEQQQEEQVKHMEEMKEEEKKGPDMALSRAQRSAEMNRGASGWVILFVS